MNYATIVWDWNGTLLDDVEACIASMNKMLSARGLATLHLRRYKEIFTFPVKNYYDLLGFDPESDPFSEIGIEFINNFKQLLPQVRLQAGADAVLEAISLTGRQQVIVSAMEQEALIRSVESLNIRHFFAEIFGIDNDYGGGKSALADRVARQLPPENHCLMIGDTLHDAEVARRVGWDCVLVSSGHQTAERLGAAGVAVFDSLSEVWQWLNSLSNCRN